MGVNALHLLAKIDKLIEVPYNIKYYGKILLWRLYPGSC